MFHFGNKKEKIVVTDKVWLSETAKWQACINEAKKNNNTIFVVWFDESFQKLETFFSENNLPTDRIFITRELARNYVQNSQLIFIEHYPLLSKEEELYDKLAIKTITVYSSLDEALFTCFGGDKISNMVKQMGMKEDEAIEHKLISSSIKTAQEKLKAKISFEQSASSQADWFLKNFK